MSLEKVKLGDICESISDGDHLPPPKSVDGIPFVTISNVNSSNQFDFKNTMFVPQEYYEKLDEKRKPRINDILYSVVGSFGIPVFIKENRPFVFQRHIAILRPNESRIHPRYLYYKMLSKDFYMKADAVAIGAAQRTISLTSLRNMEISIPCKDSQKRIADILSAYDNLIENNQKQIKLLEEAAQRLYKQWFIDLRFPGHETTPIVDGLPQGWRKGCLADIVRDVGINEKKENRTNYSYYLPIDCLPKKSLTYMDFNNIELAESSLVAFSENDIVFGAMRPYFHKVVVARDPGLTRSTCFVINTLKQSMWSYAVMLLFDAETIKYATKISVGTTMPYVRWKDFISMPILIPHENVTKDFNRIICPIIDRLKKISKQNINLKQARDRLLPKLMNGELEV